MVRRPNLLSRSVFALLALTISGCTSVFFYPTSDIVSTPTDIGIPYQDVQLSGNPELNAWWLPASSARATILFLHGNAQNISNHLPSYYWLPNSGFNVLALDYRGYGRSGGSPSAAGLADDTRRALAWIQSHHPELPIVIYGQSIGASTALVVGSNLSTTSGVQLVIAESPFASYQRIAREKLASLYLTWPFQWIAWLIIPDRSGADAAVKNWSGPSTLIISSRSDLTVPFQHSKELCGWHSADCDLWELDGYEHIQIFAEAKNRLSLLDKINAQLLPPRSLN